jgi:hypothetical protein
MHSMFLPKAQTIGESYLYNSILQILPYIDKPTQAWVTLAISCPGLHDFNDCQIEPSSIPHVQISPCKEGSFLLFLNIPSPIYNSSMYQHLS